MSSSDSTARSIPPEGDDGRVVIAAESLGRVFRVSGRRMRRAGSRPAVEGVSFTISEGETVALVGESGSGKTTTARMILGIDHATSGVVRFRGADIHRLHGKRRRAFRRSVQAVFQDATSSLNPRRSIRQIVGEPLIVNQRLHGEALTARVRALLTDVGLSTELLRSYPSQLSGGMRQRVAIAQALALNPSLIVMDEPVSALDVSIRAQVMNLLKDLQARHNIAYLIISHDLASMRYLSDTVITMLGGRIVESAPSEVFFARACHPYSLALLAASDVFEQADNSEIPQVSLYEEDLAPAPPGGCHLAARCWLRRQLDGPEICVTNEPALLEVSDGHRASCHFANRLIGDERAAVLDSATQLATTGGRIGQ